MKTCTAFLLLFVFIVPAFAQLPNTSAPKRKKDGVKEIRYYVNENDSVPEKTIYYDKQGRLAKIIYIESDGYDGSKWPVETINFDTLGRVIKVENHYTTGNDPDALTLSDRIISSTWRYTGDTMSFRIDSILNFRDELTVIQRTRMLHWTTYPAPSPRPIFWQDSLCKKSSYYYEWHYNFTENGGFKPKADSFAFLEQSNNFMLNNKICHVTTSFNIYKTDRGGNETWETLTLNPRFDTIIKTDINHSGMHDTEVVAMHYYETQRTGNRVEWINEISVYGRNRTDYGKKQPDAIWGFPEEDNSLSNYYESWELNSGDVEALTIEFYEKYYKVKVKKKIIYW